MTVRQAEAEGPKGTGVVGGEEAGILRMLVIVNSRYLADAARHRHRQFAGRVDLAGDYLSDGLTTHLTGFPNIENRIHILLCPGDTVCTSGHQAQDGRLAGRGHCLKKFFLHSRQVDVVPVAVLAASSTEGGISL